VAASLHHPPEQKKYQLKKGGISVNVRVGTGTSLAQWIDTGGAWLLISDPS
jgi:hypothetical protein